jgi:3-hydroxyisobutyrate dehydrogenase-like beta-hydroxyacid dehydrogenase
MTEVVIVGCGEVGVAYAEGVRGLDPAPTLHLMDPKPGPAGLTFAESAGLVVHRDAGSWLAGADVVLLATPGGLLERVLDSLLPHLPAGVAVADMSTAAAEAKQAAAARCWESGVDYVDVAITGSVALSKAGTPLLYAGPEIPVLVSLFEQLDAPLTVLEDSRPGDAMRVKLLRSVIMKGLEGLAVECLPAAAEYGVLDHLWASLGDVDRTGFVALLQAMTRTHPRHAARREHEVADAAGQLEAICYPSAMTRAAEQRFAATNAATARSGWPEHDTTEGAIAWLRSLQAPVTD